MFSAADLTMIRAKLNNGLDVLASPRQHNIDRPSVSLDDWRLALRIPDW